MMRFQSVAMSADEIRWASPLVPLPLIYSYISTMGMLVTMPDGAQVDVLISLQHPSIDGELASTM